MAPNYRLTYFNLKGLGEPIRMLLAYGNIKYEDNRIEVDDWPKLRSSTPFRQVPILDIDGKRITQSTAICRYLAKQLKLTGNNDMEDLEIDSIIDAIHDFRLKTDNVFFEEDENIKKKKLVELKKDVIPFYLAKFEEIAKENNGHMACKKLTWADIVLVGISDPLNTFSGTDIFANNTYLKKVQTNVLAIPNIKRWIDTRPNTPY